MKTTSRLALVFSVLFTLAAPLLAAPQDNWVYERDLTRPNDSVGVSDMACGADGTLYVLQGDNATIEVYNPEGVYQRRVSLPAGFPKSDYTNSDRARSLAVDANGQFYVADNASVWVVSASGTLVRRLGWGSGGTADGEFGVWSNYPYSSGIRVAVDTNGDVYATDPINGRVMVFSSSGTFLRKFGTAGTAPGQLNFGSSENFFYRASQSASYYNFRTSGIALNAAGQVVVTDVSNLHSFSKQGAFIERTDRWAFADGYYSYNSGDLSLRSLMPDGVGVRGNGQLILNGSRLRDADKPLCTVQPTTGALFELAGSTETGFYDTQKTIQLYRRTYTTFGATSAKQVPQPSIVQLSQRSNSSIIDIDYKVVDGDSSTVTVGLAAFRGRYLSGCSTISDIKNLIVVKAADLVEGTASKLGANQPTGVTQRLSWDASKDGVPSGGIEFEIYARDDRAHLLPVDFITLPTTPALTISRSPLTNNDFRDVWAWLLTQGDPALSRDPATGAITGTGGAFTENDYSATTAVGRAWLLAKLGLREATRGEVDQAQKAGTTVINKFTPAVSVAGRPSQVNTWTFDTGSSGTWVVPAP